MSRERAIAVIREVGDETPHGDIGKFCAFAGIPVPRFFEIAKRFRNGEVWKRRSDGVWHIPGFIVPDWRWA
jgi:hypothetical protein